MQQISLLGSYPFTNNAAANFSVNHRMPNIRISNPQSSPQEPKFFVADKNNEQTTPFLETSFLASIVSTAKTLNQKYKNYSLKSIPEDLQTTFKSLDGLNGKKFVEKAYSELVKYMGLEGIAPKRIEFTKTKQPFQIEGGYVPAHNKIEFSDNFLYTLSKAEQINLIAHELRHCKQFTDMLRTEGISVEKFAQAVTELNINSTKRNNTSFKHNYYRAKKQNKTEEFLNNARKDTYKEVLELIEKNFAHILKMPKYEKDSLESREALRNIETIYSYNGVNSLGLILEGYKEQLIELDAYQFGEMIKDLFKKYQYATT